MVIGFRVYKLLSDFDARFASLAITPP
eukprot:COSAG01_NODE_73580_length_241_cov_1631.154930_1_plen_26_part_10